MVLADKTCAAVGPQEKDEKERAHSSSIRRSPTKIMALSQTRCSGFRRPRHCQGRDG